MKIEMKKYQNNENGDMKVAAKKIGVMVKRNRQKGGVKMKLRALKWKREKSGHHAAGGGGVKTAAQLDRRRRREEIWKYLHLLIFRSLATCVKYIEENIYIIEKIIISDTHVFYSEREMKAILNLSIFIIRSEGKYVTILSVIRRLSTMKSL